MCLLKSLSQCKTMNCSVCKHLVSEEQKCVKINLSTDSVEGKDSVTASRLSYPWVIYHAYGILFLGGEGGENHDYNSEFTSQRQQAEFE